MPSPKRFRLKPPPPLKENDIERACVDLLRLRGYWVIRQQSGLFKTPDGRWIRIGMTGVPDYAAIHERFPGFLLEVKRPESGVLSVEQIRKIQEIEMGYRLAIVIVDDAKQLRRWLIEHEGKATRLWDETKTK